MWKTSKRLTSLLLILTMLFAFIPFSLAVSADDPAVPGEFNETFGGIANIGESVGLGREGSGGTMAIVSDPETGKALQVTGGGTYGGAILRTKEATPANFKLEYRFKIVDGDGDFHNWLASPPGGGEGNSKSNPIFGYEPNSWRGSNCHLISGWDSYGGGDNPLVQSMNFGAGWNKATITFYNGTYTLYINEQKIGERNFGERANGGHLRFQVREGMNMLFDYIKVEAYEETVIIEPPTMDISFNKTGHIFHTAEKVEFDLDYYNASNTAQTVGVSYEVKNHKGAVVQQGSLNNLAVSALGKLNRKIDLGDFGTGLFTLTVSANAGSGNIVTKSMDFSRVFPVIADRKGEPFANGTHIITASAGTLATSLNLLELGGVAMIRDDFAWQSAESSINGPIVIPQAWHNFVDATLAKGIEPLVILAYGNTNYASIDPGMRNRGIPVTDTGRKAFARFALKLIEEMYPKGVRYFEVWNEPNHVGGGTAPFNPNGATAADYTALLKEVYESIDRDLYPDIKILSASTAPFNNLTDTVFIKGMLDAGAAPYIDILSVHPYTYSGGASAEDRNLVYWLNQADALIRQYNNGESVPIWVTEIGWPTHVGDGNGVSEEVSASYMVRSFTQMLSLDYIGKLVWYDFMNDGNRPDYNENNFGTVRNSSDPVLPWGAKASYVAQNVMANLLYKAEYVSSTTGGSEYSYRFKRADGKDVIVAWNTAAERSVNVTVGNGEFKVYDMYGNETTVQVNNGEINVVISKIPIYIVGDMSGALISDPELLKFTPAYENGEWFIEANIKNSTDEPMSGTVRITAPAALQSDAVAFDSIPADSAAKILIPVSDPGLELYNITVRADITDYGIVTENRATSFLRAEKVSTPIIIDGVLDPDEWSGAQEIVLDRADQTRSGASATQQMQNWGGPDDLSAKIYLKWDDDNLYMAVEVKDDIHSQTRTGGNTWMGDSVQFTFDQGRAAGINSQGFSHVVMALTDAGAVENWRVESAHGGADSAVPDYLIETVIVRDDETGITVYEAAISWELLGGTGMAAKTNSLFGFSLLVNDNDGPARRGWIQYMDGIGFGGRNPNLFGDLILAGETKVPEPTLVSAVPAAKVAKLNGSRNDLTITVTELYSDGSEIEITATISINNNAAGTYEVGGYKVYVDTKGNDQIRACYIVE